jgi:glycosyltransferase involved in cell wall biosynthesis
MVEDEIKESKHAVLGPDKEDYFVAFWMNRNAKRKRPSDLLWSWKIFLEKLQETHGHKKAMLLMHTDPLDPEGPNLYMVTEELGIADNVIFSTHRIEFEKINVLHNISDVCVNISYAEGFGLTTLESMQTGTPIVALKTGGLTRQAVDHRDGSENGVALDVDFRSMVGSQQVPYIYEDYCSVEKTATALLKMHDLSKDEKKALSKKVRDYALSEFSYQKTIDLWHDSLTDLSENWKTRYKPWTCESL